ncbi:hypothetical protein EDB86DRAFT_2831111 [Lactarius hatsudake]|nr:hypothetical protein EDB86DRAFT_2831111 [Lactarius hatsudake]
MSFQPILDAALADYSKEVGIDLEMHPLADGLRSCDSPDDVLKVLEDKANQFKDFRDGNRKLLNWLSPVVKVVHTLSGVLDASIALVPFGPAKAIFAGMDVFITVRILLHSESQSASPHFIWMVKAAGGVSSSYDALVDLFECLGNFLKRLRIYTDLPLSPSVTEITVKIMVELLSVLALATKQIKQGRLIREGSKLRREIRKEVARRKRNRGRVTEAGPSHTRGRSDDYGPDARSCVRTCE